jgi:hypothetical protein
VFDHLAQAAVDGIVFEVQRVHRTEIELGSFELANGNSEVLASQTLFAAPLLRRSSGAGQP